VKRNSENEKGTHLKVRAYKLGLAVIKLIDTLDRRDTASRAIADQLIRSATSIGANIIEAQAGSSKKDFTNFYSHALKSANETKYWLALLRDAHKVKTDAINPLLQETTEVANMLGASVLTLRGKK